MKLLIVDDEMDLLEEIADDLTESGHEIITAENGKRAYNIFSEHEQSFDGVLTDVRMPIMDGLTLLKRIKRDKPTIPVAIFTGHGDVDTAIQALQLGAIDFILKPFQLHTLYSAIARFEALHTSKKVKSEILPFVQSVKLEIPGQLKYIDSVISYLSNQFTVLCDSARVNSNEINLCLKEALTNAIVHGNMQISSMLKEESWEKFDMLIKEREKDPTYVEKCIELTYQHTENQIVFEVEDQGTGFNYRMLPNFKDPMTLIYSGRGLLLINSFMDEVSWNESGNRIKMVKHLKKLGKA